MLAPLQVAVGVVLVFSVGWWVVDARRWFKGPIKQVCGSCLPIYLRYLFLTTCPTATCCAAL